MWRTGVTSHKTAHILVFRPSYYTFDNGSFVLGARVPFYFYSGNYIYNSFRPTYKASQKWNSPKAGMNRDTSNNREMRNEHRDVSFTTNTLYDHDITTSTSPRTAPSTNTHSPQNSPRQ